MSERTTSMRCSASLACVTGTWSATSEPIRTYELTATRINPAAETPKPAISSRRTGHRHIRCNARAGARPASSAVTCATLSPRHRPGGPFGEHAARLSVEVAQTVEAVQEDVQGELELELV